jgi:hypothetical protein
MRRPRIEDYDPNAKLPELASPIDGMPGIGKPPQKVNGVSPTSLPEQPVIQEEQAKQTKAVRANARTPVRPYGRTGRASSPEMRLRFTKTRWIDFASYPLKKK